VLIANGNDILKSHAASATELIVEVPFVRTTVAHESVTQSNATFAILTLSVQVWLRVRTGAISS
jgi:hypothetical protein